MIRPFFAVARPPIAFLPMVFCLCLLVAMPAGADSKSWLVYGQNHQSHRFSELEKINKSNVDKLRPVFVVSTAGKLAGLTSTPLFSDGMLYFSADYSRVFAVDARTGAVRWKFEPEYDEDVLSSLCCGPVNRGIALHQGKVFVATLDAKLVSLNALDGKVLWSQSVSEGDANVSATMAPMVIRDHVIVGVSGEDFGVRGNLKSFNAHTGALEWTTYTIPSSGEHGSETWSGDSAKLGGGTAWMTGSYDPELNLVYWGTGSPAAAFAETRAGDNLWTNSLLAISPDTGRIAWGFQFTPNDSWGYDGIGPPVLADIAGNGLPLKVAVQSNRNGFLYIINRETGQFLHATPTIEGINWTKGIDETGRPIVVDAMRPKIGGPPVGPIIPSSEGGSNWFPMAFDPGQGVVYLNTNYWGMVISPSTDVRNGQPPDSTTRNVRLGDWIGQTKAYDLRARRWLWERRSPLPLYSGVLATKSGLVFTGDERGFFLALDAATGRELWQFQTGSGINASPISYELDGHQYVAILSGMGGGPSFYYSGQKGGMLWVFSVDGVLQDKADGYVTEIDGALPSSGN